MCSVKSLSLSSTVSFFSMFKTRWLMAGMKDDLMDIVVDAFEPSKMPIAMKYIAYGKLSEVMPFLGRRAIENKSLMSGDAGAAAERRRIVNELKRRYL